MTVSDPGAGQQQGREGDDRVCSGCLREHCVCPCPCGCNWDVRKHSAPSPTPPARDSGRDEAREAVSRSDVRVAIAQWMADEDGYHWGRMKLGELTKVLQKTDRLLALPELAKLLRRPA